MLNALSCGPEEKNLPPLPLPLPLLLLLRLAEPKPMVELLDAALLTVTSENRSRIHPWIMQGRNYPSTHAHPIQGFRY
jgi:hypothetical protein